VAVALAATGDAALVGSGAYVLCHLRLQQLLHHPLDDLTQKAGVVQQGSLQVALRQFRIHPTMIFGHRHSVLIG